MLNQTASDEIEQTLEEFSINVEASLSPQTNSNHHKQFYSPYHIAEFSELPKPEISSPDFLFEFTNSFKKIMENDNEESSENSEVFDIMGNPINEFIAPAELEEIPQTQYLSADNDKQNEGLPSYIKTPLKIERKEVRSPLEDITPSMTHKKIKTSSKHSISAKRPFLTPRTMEKSRLASSGFVKIERW